MQGGALPRTPTTKRAGRDRARRGGQRQGGTQSLSWHLDLRRDGDTTPPHRPARGLSLSLLPMFGPVREIYLDANASAPLRPEARAAILSALDLGPGNASSPHGAGRRLRRALGDARDTVAALLGARASEIVFTSGATESNALAIGGALAARPGPFVTTMA